MCLFKGTVVEQIAAKKLFTCTVEILTIRVFPPPQPSVFVLHWFNIYRDIVQLKIVLALCL